MENALSIPYSKYPSLNDLPQEFKALVIEARKASETAWAPYSHYQVGAALLLSDGTILKGSNQENAAYPSGLCAERTVLFHYGSTAANPNPIVAIALSARPEGVMEWQETLPCGSCRQVMLEYQNRQTEPFKVIMQDGNQGFIILEKASLLLPFAFDSRQLPQ